MASQYDTRWHPCFMVGHDTLDGQHKRLFKRYQGIVEIMEGGTSLSSAGALLHELRQDVQRHFRIEESILESCGYDALEQHRGEHRQHLEELARLIEAAGSSGLPDDAARQYLGQWWINHILNHDKDYSLALSGW